MVSIISFKGTFIHGAPIGKWHPRQHLPLLFFFCSLLIFASLSSTMRWGSPHPNLIVSIVVSFLPVMKPKAFCILHTCSTTGKQPQPWPNHLEVVVDFAVIPSRHRHPIPDTARLLSLFLLWTAVACPYAVLVCYIPHGSYHQEFYTSVSSPSHASSPERLVICTQGPTSSPCGYRPQASVPLLAFLILSTLVHAHKCGCVFLVFSSQHNCHLCITTTPGHLSSYSLFELLVKFITC